MRTLTRWEETRMSMEWEEINGGREQKKDEGIERAMHCFLKKKQALLNVISSLRYCVH